LKTFLEGNRLYVTTSKAVLPSTSAPQISTQIKLANGYIALGNGWNLTYEEITADNLNAQARNNSDRFTAWLDAGLTAEKLWVRTILSGDRFEPLGMPHQTIKLAELFINLKVPQRLRRNWPLVCVGDEIAWVPGLRLAEPFKVTDLTQTALKIKIYKVVGQV
jgi:tRNA(Ile)-lysidine synthetase-like protein